MNARHHSTRRSRLSKYLGALVAACVLALLVAAIPGCVEEDSTACLEFWSGACSADRFVPDETSFCRDDTRYVVRSVNGDAELTSGWDIYGDDDDSGGWMLCCVPADVQPQLGSGECKEGRGRPSFGGGVIVG
jgi:hypothetical protein